MPRPREGSIFERQDRKGIWAKFRYKDDFGKQQNVVKKFATKTEARKWLKQKIRELDEHGASLINSEAMTFAELAKFYESHKVKPPVLREGKKVAGLRSFDSVLRRLRTLIGYFGKKRIRTITHADVEAFKLHRLEAENQRRPGTSLTIATVNRELQILRGVLNFAVRQSWLIRSPFSLGESLISLTAETKRNRVLTREEEEKLLSVCIGRRAHLKSLLIAGLDTGARKGELLALRWKHIDFPRNLITVEATKTDTTRYVAMTARLRDELRTLLLQSPNNPDDLVFGLLDNFKRSFATACRLAGVTGFRFHDARHCFATRLIEAGLSTDQAKKLTGHTQSGTFDRYHNQTEEAAQHAASALDNWRNDGQFTLNSEMVQ